MVETTTTTLRANALISPTWHRLNMNEAEVDVVDSIADGIEIHVPEGAQEAEFGAFATAALAAWATRPEQAKTQNNTQPDDEILNGRRSEPRFGRNVARSRATCLKPSSTAWPHRRRVARRARSQNACRACSRWYRTCRAHRRARAWQKRRRKRRFPRRCRRRRRERTGTCVFRRPRGGRRRHRLHTRRIRRCPTRT